MIYPARIRLAAAHDSSKQYLPFLYRREMDKMAMGLKKREDQRKAFKGKGRLIWWWFIDEAKALRDSDTFDIQAVHHWLRT